MTTGQKKHILQPEYFSHTGSEGGCVYELFCTDSIVSKTLRLTVFLERVHIA